MSPIHFNIPYVTSESAVNIQQLIDNPLLVNKGIFLKKCSEWFETYYPGYTAFMTTSCTRSLELVALSLQVSPGDEIILSPFNYVGVGNAFANYGSQLVYVDIEPQTMNIDINLIESAITSRTKAIIAMHYAGVPCDMEKIRQLCDTYKLVCIEDNAQGIGVHHQGQPLGSYGDYTAMSFDTLKNISCNEGGVLLCKNELAAKVEVAFSNGSNRTAFLKGEVKKYEWVARGSKFTMNEYTAAVLHPLLENCDKITAARKKIWDDLYNKIAAVHTLQSYIPKPLMEFEHNGHIAYLKFEDTGRRDRIMKYMNEQGVPCAFHYVPLDQSMAGRRFGNTSVECAHSARQSSLLLRLPMHHYLSGSDLDRIVSVLKRAVEQPEIN